MDLNGYLGVVLIDSVYMASERRRVHHIYLTAASCGCGKGPRSKGTNAPSKAMTDWSLSHLSQHSTIAQFYKLCLNNK